MRDKLRRKFKVFVLAGVLASLVHLSSCIEESATVPPTVAFTYTIDEETGNTVTFNNNSLKANEYTWSFGDGNTSRERDPVHTYAADNTYTVELIATGDGGTRETSQDIVIMKVPEEPDFFSVFDDQFAASARYFPFQQTSVDVIAQDRGTKLAGEASLRIDVPENGNSYAGGYVIVDTEVDLSGYNAMSFYARGPSDANIGIIGFGLDADGDRDLAGVENIGLSTSWEKYYLPLPDPSRLEREDAIFFFSIGSEGSAFSIWLDDIRFETIEGLSNLTPLINNGEETQEAGYVGQTFFINTSYTFRGNSGTERTMTASPTYFDFTSSNENAAAVSQNGEIEITGDGSAEITASSTGTNANGSVSVQSRGIFDNFAPTPDKDPNDVLSVFSDAYTNEGGINPGVFANEEIGIELISIGDQNTLEYQEIAFVGIGWGNTADVTRYDFVHIDVYVSNPSNAALAIEIIDHGTDQVLGGSDDTAGRFTIASSSITNGEWIGLDIPLNGFTGNTGGGGQGNPALTNVGTVVLVAADGRRINTLVDNIYFYRQ